VYRCIISSFSIFALLILSYTLYCHFYSLPENHSPTIVTPPNEYWMEWDSQEGLKRQETSQYKANLFKLLRFYESQIRGTYCGIATAVVALNSLSIESLKSQYLENSYLFTQEEFFEGKIGETIDPARTKKQGLTLNDMAKVMKTQPLMVNAYEAAYFTDEEIRYKIMTALTNPNQTVIALYHRKELKQEGAGHWSPVAAYDRKSDSFLILDVARYKYPPAWVDGKAFIAAMKAPNDKGVSRGFLILDNSSFKGTKAVLNAEW